MCGVRVLCLLALLPALVLGADHRTTAAEVAELVFISVYSDHDDQRLARELASVRLADRLTPSTVAYFENIGVGPRTFVALKSLRDKSAELPLPPELALAGQSAPPQPEQTRILGRLFDYVQSYIHNLPNFLCDEVTRRYSNLNGYEPDGNPRYGRKLHHSDNFTRHLRFASGLDEGHVEQVLKRGAENVETRMGQSFSNGEFGGDMNMIFGLGIDPELRWHHWEISKTGRRAVFSYFVGLPKTKFNLVYCCFLKAGVEM